MSSPPDLEILCKKLSSTPPAQLPRSLPALTNHVSRCGPALSTTPSDQKKPKDDDGSRTAVLVHRLKTTITTLLTGRSPEARFAAVGVVKAVVDVGGWETLRGAEPWVRGLLSIVQKGDALATKELAIITLTRIYTLLHPYQTLTRELATPTIPTFATSCLQLFNSPTPSPPTIIETICEAFTTLIPLYPTTFRPFATQTRSAARPYLAPTSSDAIYVPPSLQRTAGRLIVSLHHVAAKSGSSDDWAKMVQAVIRDLHATADQVLRAVVEAWYPSDGYVRSVVSPDGEPHGGSSSPEQLPPWTGLSAGVDRLIGLFNHLADYLSCPTRTPVAIPLSAIMGTISRLTSIVKPTCKSHNWDQYLEANPAILREERQELCTLLPQIHIAATDLTLTLLQRFDRALIPLVPDILDNLVRIFKSGMDIPSTRRSAYRVLHAILSFAGPTLSKQAVSAIEPLLAACCRDLQQEAALLGPETPAGKKEMANADLFLIRPSTPVLNTALDADHIAAARRLLPLLLSDLPQEYLKASLRGLMDRTAILTRSREAMLASVLHPYRDGRRRMYPSILPHLTRQFPHDQSLEVIRTNLRVSDRPAAPIEMEVDVTEKEQDTDRDDEESVEDETPHQSLHQQNLQEELQPKDDAGTIPSPSVATEKIPVPQIAPQVSSTQPEDNPITPKPAATCTAPSNAAHPQPPKRKHDASSAANPPKRHEAQKPEAKDPNPLQRHHVEKSEAMVDAIPVVSHPPPQPRLPPPTVSDDDSDGSVHLNMELDDDEVDEPEDGVHG
ncbi:Pre-rRNA-processing protein rix1 [Ophiocordyceps camponoti-floridani]|uniref:Pre-rRNA-processing protein RIX1 n=1 Tax=Ophiocordyceps camponoti-floridani TaxID=2030778 RepID=A0A8H4Q0R2_9HYPO|nr:Pre-rRNA-processing protein rix1 [Ophiocordyceps camponoti-floridani]